MTATPNPPAIVSGSPTPSRRAGSETSSRSVARLMRDASENSTRVRVTSASTLTTSLEVAGSTRPSASAPTSTPAIVNTMGAVTGVPDSRPDTAA